MGTIHIFLGTILQLISLHHWPFLDLEGSNHPTFLPIQCVVLLLIHLHCQTQSSIGLNKRNFRIFFSVGSINESKNDDQKNCE